MTLHLEVWRLQHGDLHVLEKADYLCLRKGDGEDGCLTNGAVCFTLVKLFNDTAGVIDLKLLSGS